MFWPESWKATCLMIPTKQAAFSDELEIASAISSSGVSHLNLLTSNEIQLVAVRLEKIPQKIGVAFT